MLYLRYAFFVAWGLALGLYELTLRSFLPYPADLFLPVFPFIVLALALDRPRYAFVMAGAAGAVSDVFAPEHNRFALIGYLLLVALLLLIARAVFTNRSLYAALALVVLARVFDYLWTLAAQYLLSFSSSVSLVPGWRPFLGEIVADLLATGFLFLVANLLLRRFNWYAGQNRRYG